MQHLGVNVTLDPRSMTLNLHPNKVDTPRNKADMLTKGLTTDVRNTLDAILAQIAEAIVYGRVMSDEMLGSNGKLQIDKKVRGKLAAAAK